MRTKNIVLFLIGFCAFITIEVLFRHYSYAISGIMGGLAVVIIDKINDRISWDMDLLLQGLIGCAIITFIELVVGVFARLFGYQMWDYSNLPLNYYGIICVPFSCVWFMLAIVAVFTADAINYYVFGEEPVPYYRIAGKTCIRFKSREVLYERD